MNKNLKFWFGITLVIAIGLICAYLESLANNWYLARTTQISHDNRPPVPLHKAPAPSQVKSPKINDVTPRVNISSTKPIVSDALYNNFVRVIQNDLLKNDFAAIEKKAADALVNKKRIDGGSWKIRIIDVSVDHPVKKTNPSEEDWRVHFERLEKWNERFPSSLTARLALSGSYIKYAWEARGDDYAHSVSDENNKLFLERLEKAGDVLARASLLAERSPVYYEQLLILARAQGWTSDNYDRLFREAISYEPEYQYFYREKAVNLLPRWHGKPGEWEQFALETMNSIGGKKGVEMYYQIVANISPYYGARNFTQENKIDWEKTREGFAEFEKNHGVTGVRLNEFGRLAMNLFDDETSCEIFKRLGENDYAEEVWQSKESFIKYRKAALQSCEVVESNKRNREFHQISN